MTFLHFLSLVTHLIMIWDEYKFKEDYMFNYI